MARNLLDPVTHSQHHRPDTMMLIPTDGEPTARTVAALVLLGAIAVACGGSGAGPDTDADADTDVGAGTGGGEGVGGDESDGGGVGSGLSEAVDGADGNPDEVAVERPVGFEDVSAMLGDPPIHGDDYGVFWADYDNDERPDLVFMGHSLDPLLLAQRADGGFEDVSAANGLRKTGEPEEYFQQDDRHGGSCADYDNDGFADVFISHGAFRGETLGEKFDELVKGRGDLTFENVSRRAVSGGGLLNPSGRGRHGTWADYDNDGLVDLYVANFDPTDDEFESPNVMYRNNGDGTFSDVTETTGLGISAFRSAWSDFDQDGNIDLLVTSPLRLLRNTGTGRFEDVTKRWTGEENLFGYGLAWADLDSDGDQDFVVSALSTKVYAFMNRGDRFERLEGAPFAAEGTLRVTGITPADIDNDGDIDLVQNTSNGLFMYVNDGDMEYTLSSITQRMPDLEYTHGDIAMADYDGDGLLDFATDDIGAYRLFRNDAANANHWLGIRLAGTTNNAMGFGARVRVSVDGELVAFREYTGSSAGLRSMGCSPLHVGLGEHERVDIDVTWPNGRESSLRNVDADRTIVISE